MYILYLALQIYKVLNIRVVGLRAETWTNGDLYGTYNPEAQETLFLFRDYVVDNIIQEPYDAAILLTYVSRLLQSLLH